MMRRAFTLIELLVVMAVSAVLFTIIAIPMVQSFNLTRAGQSFAAAQSQARLISERVQQDISNAAAVRDNSGSRGSLVIRVPGADGVMTESLAPYAKLDLLMPAKGNPLGPGGPNFNEETGKIDPTIAGPKGDPSLPTLPGTVLVRWFIGLRDPFLDYGNPNVDLRLAGGNRWAGVSNGIDNPYVLYRAEVPAYAMGEDTTDWDRDGDAAEVIMRPNWNLFAADAEGQPIWDDPTFFSITDADQAQGAAFVEAKSRRIRAWRGLAINQSTDGRVDALVFNYDLGSRLLTFVGNVPDYSAAVRMQPTRVASEPASPVNPMGSGLEAANAAKVGPSVYRTAAGSWGRMAARVHLSIPPAAYTDAAQAGAENAPWHEANSPERRLDMRNVNGFGQSLVYVQTGQAVFSIDRYLQARSQSGQPNPPHAFSFATLANASLPAVRRDFLPIAPDPSRGQVTAAFDIQDVGVDNTVPVASRLPSTQPGSPATAIPGINIGEALPVQSDPSPIGNWTAWQNAAVGINRRFNAIYNQWDNILAAEGLPNVLDRSQGARRFIDLRTIPQPDGTLSPLDPARGWSRARIVPGSETVIGPDQQPGANFGNYVRYTRSLTRPVGVNEYYINYVHQPEPAWIDFGITANYDPSFYDPNDFFSAVIQSPYRVGYLELNSAPGEPLPNLLDSGVGVNTNGRIIVDYDFAFTEPNDVVVVDYDTNEVVEVLVTVVNYAPTGGPNPQSITLRASAEARNVLR